MLSLRFARLADLKRWVRPMTPVALIDRHARRAASLQATMQQTEEAKRRDRLNKLRCSVQSAIDLIGALSAQQSADAWFLEHELIPALGLNDELLHEQPPQLFPSLGQGLHLWQYPNQLGRYLA